MEVGDVEFGELSRERAGGVLDIQGMALDEIH